MQSIIMTLRRAAEAEGKGVTMTINDTIMYFFGIAAAVFIVVIFFDKLRCWFWGRHPKRRE